MIVDNSENPLVMVAEGNQDSGKQIFNQSIFKLIFEK